VLVDTRSSPFSKYSPHFNQELLASALRAAHTKYLFFGNELGGKPKQPSFYDEDGYVLYWKIAETPAFEQAIQRLRKGTAQYRVALLCSEENPTGCHRRLLIGRVLRTLGVTIFHIRANGRLQTEDELDLANGTASQQMTFLSSVSETKVWRSIQSASPKKMQLSSSSH
jgi:uncharacterized protein (DUF488 family)